MLHNKLHRPRRRNLRRSGRLSRLLLHRTRSLLHILRTPARSIVQGLDFAPSDNLLQAPIMRIADLDEVSVEEDEIRAMQSSRLRRADEIHDDAAADVAVFVDVHGAVGVHEEELLVREAEHGQRFLVFDVRGDVLDVLGAELGHGPGLLLVEGEDFEAAGGGDGEGRVEEVDACAFGRDVEVVVFAEELGGAALEDAALFLAGFLVDGFEDFEDGGEVLALLVEDEGAVFHSTGDEEADVFAAG